ncbi:MAG: hypothetical protein H6718_05010 [Polyangiaceae bacterium]|nr:hypothetical protein [Myxococcales bacterium]MCB9584731.1 hypothetical protein [Polyangiaceae bacterium]MCB9607696.1 hypothetical protein [Polyangiaceae bacterium]
MKLRRWTRQSLFGSVLVCALMATAGGCSSDDEAEAPKAKAVPGVSVRFDLQASHGEAFYDFPYPADARLGPNGSPDIANFPNPAEKGILSSLVKIAGEHPGFPTVPVAYFHFDAPITAPRVQDVIPADTSSSILLVDIDPASPERGKLFPTIAKLPNPDIYVPENLLAVASFPGVVLNPERSYAFVVMRGLGDATGAPLGSPLEFEKLKFGEDPEGMEGLAAQYAPLWDTLKTLGVDKGAVAAATVFTTGDVVKETFDLSERVLEKYDVTLENLEVDPDDGASHDRFCEIIGTVDFPQFQQGTPPFDTEGLFEFGADGMPVEQRKETAKIVITLPKQPMPAGGYPLVMYFHGSGGIAGQVVDRGKVTEIGGETTKGEGPAFVLAPHGFATVGSSHPLSPDRLPGASDIEYLNFKNLAAMRDTFRQGVIEQRLYLEALSKLEITPDLVAGCTGLSLPSGEASYHFATKPVLAMGQSMGGMYTNMIGAVEPRIEAVVPTGAGGFWSLFIEETDLVKDLDRLAGVLLGSSEVLDHLHPTLQILQTGWEAVEPMVYTPRLARRHLDGHPVRSIYEPAGKGDSYFSTKIYDAFSLAYGNQQAGDTIWPEMQTSLAVGGFEGFADYPVTGNRVSEDGTPYTGVVVQYEGDGIYDPHAIYGQLDAVKHQYGCFFETYLKTGTATVRAPETIDSPCQ